MQRAVEDSLGGDGGDFLERFKAYGWYLDDLVRPIATGLAIATNTIGMVAVADFRARAGCGPGATIKSGVNATNSAAKAGRRSGAKRYSTSRFLPSIQPFSRKPLSHAA
jgi:hypothetical protein